MWEMENDGDFSPPSYQSHGKNSTFCLWFALTGTPPTPRWDQKIICREKKRLRHWPGNRRVYQRYRKKAWALTEVNPEAVSVLFLYEANKEKAGTVHLHHGKYAAVEFLNL